MDQNRAKEENLADSCFIINTRMNLLASIFLGSNYPPFLRRRYWSGDRVTKTPLTKTPLCLVTSPFTARPKNASETEITHLLYTRIFCSVWCIFASTEHGLAILLVFHLWRQHLYIECLNNLLPSFQSERTICCIAGVFPATARPFISYFMVTWHLTMKPFPAKCHEWATLQKLWSQTENISLLPAKCWLLSHMIRAYSWSGLMLSLESQRVFKTPFCFLLLHNKSLNDWSLGEQWILFPPNLRTPLTPPRSSPCPHPTPPPSPQERYGKSFLPRRNSSKIFLTSFHT